MEAYQRFASFILRDAIPEIGGRPGDHLVASPEDRTAPLQLVRQVRDGQQSARVLRDNRSGLHLVHASGPIEIDRLIMDMAGWEHTHAYPFDEAWTRPSTAAPVAEAVQAGGDRRLRVVR